jgi:hypothetical protein
MRLLHGFNSLRNAIPELDACHQGFLGRSFDQAPPHVVIAARGFHHPHAGRSVFFFVNADVTVEVTPLSAPPPLELAATSL